MVLSIALGTAAVFEFDRFRFHRVMHDGAPPACARSSTLLLLLPRSTIRGAMVNIMLAGGSPQHSLHHHSARPLLFQPSSTWCEHGFVDTTQDCFGDISAKKEASDWSDAPPAAGGGTPRLPRDSSTCILWCAIALGALVRGHPIPQVGAFLSSRVSRPAPPLPCKPDVACNLSARAILTRLATLASRRKFRPGGLGGCCSESLSGICCGKWFFFKV